MSPLFILIFAWLTSAGQPKSYVEFYPDQDTCVSAAAVRVNEISGDPVQSNGLWVCLAAPLALPDAQPKGSI